MRSLDEIRDSLERNLRRQIKDAGGLWNADKQAWEIRYEHAIARGIEARIVAVARCQSSLSMYTDMCTKNRMKRRELEEALRKLGWSFLRHGAKHDIWAKGEQQEPIPRHAEINENLARAILRRAAQRE